jgi:putative SOS response-associated peptidase YedK
MAHSCLPRQWPSHPLDRAAVVRDMYPDMCGRFLNKLPPAETARLFATKNVAPNYPTRFNIAPTDPVLAVRFDPKTGARSLDALRWGLVPHFAKDLSSGARFINARAETVATLPTVRDAFKRRRCLIAASGFYEWRKDGKTKTPYAIVPTDGPLFAFAGLWENWRDRSAGDEAPWIRTCTIITGEPNALLAPIHDRMPVILPEEAWPQWLRGLREQVSARPRLDRSRRSVSGYRPSPQALSPSRGNSTNRGHR